MTRSLRPQLDAGKTIVAPGAWDCLTGNLVAAAGFDAVYMTGGGAAVALGYPDYGLTTMTEMVAIAGRLADSVGVPVIADADTGFGNELNAIRTVREFEKAGVAAIQIEDQVFPKRCGHLDNKELVTTGSFVAKIRAAASARRGEELCLIARTDALASEGLDVAVGRVNEALAAGADLAFVEAPRTVEEMREIPRRVDGRCVLNLAAGGKSPLVELPDAEEMGYAIVIVPALLLSTVLEAGGRMLAELKATGRHPTLPRHVAIRELFELVSIDRWDSYSNRFAETAR